MLIDYRTLIYRLCAVLRGSHCSKHHSSGGSIINHFLTQAPSCRRRHTEHWGPLKLAQEKRLRQRLDECLLSPPTPSDNALRYPWAKMTKSSRPLLACGPQKTHLKWFGPIINRWQWCCQAPCKRTFPLQFPYLRILAQWQQLHKEASTRSRGVSVGNRDESACSGSSGMASPPAISGSSPGGQRATSNGFG